MKPGPTQLSKALVLISAFQLLQGANTLGLKKEEKPLSWYVWAPTWAEIREVTVGNYGLQSSIGLSPTCVQVMGGGSVQSLRGHQKGNFPFLVSSLPPAS